MAQGVLYLLYCEKGACWPSKWRWPRYPWWPGRGWKDFKILILQRRTSKAELSQERHATTLLSHSAASKQASSLMYTSQSQDTLGRGARLWSQMGKRKEIWSIEDDGICPLGYYLQTSEKENTMPRSHLYTHFNLSLKRNIFFIITFPFPFAAYKKTHYKTYPLGFQGMPRAKLRSPFQDKISI